MWETRLQSVGGDNPLEKEVATHSSILSCLGKSHGQRSLTGYSPWGHKEMDTTEQLSTHLYCGCGCIAQVLELDGLVPALARLLTTHVILGRLLNLSVPCVIICKLSMQQALFLNAC